jgi:hypothetical protein
MKPRAFAIVVLCLLMVVGAACGSSKKKSASTDLNATATANVQRARTATAQAAGASPAASPSGGATAHVASPTTAVSATKPASSPTQAASPSSTSIPTNDASPTTAAGDAEVAQQLAQIEQQTSKVRGLQPTGTVPEQIIDHDQLRANLEQELQKSYSQTQADQDTQELWLLRLINDPKLDLYKLQLDLLSEQVIGYYDNDSKELFVISDTAGLPPLAQYTMSHEYTHALQDQRFDLSKMTPENSHNADRDSAVTALIEGDATLSSTYWALQYMSKSDLSEIVNGSGELSSAVLDSAPQYLQKSLLFPYDQGLNFVTSLYGQGQFAEVDKVFADPPTSTEQILHPEKYLSAQRDNPVDVTLADITGALGDGWAQQDTDTLGEFDLNEMLVENGAASADANTAAAGWGGARYALYQNGADGVMVMDSVWDSQADADEFAAGLRATLPSDTIGDNLWSVDGRFISVTEQGGHVLYIAGTTQAAVQAAVAAYMPS